MLLGSAGSPTFIFLHEQRKYIAKDHNTLWEGAEEETHKNSLGHLYKSFHKFVIDALLHKDATGGEAYLTLVGKGGTDHGGKTLLQVGIVKYNTRIFATKLVCGMGGGQCWMDACITGRMCMQCISIR